MDIVLGFQCKPSLTLPPSIAGRARCYSPLFIVFKGVHAFAAKGRLRFDGQKYPKAFFNP